MMLTRTLILSVLLAAPVQAEKLANKLFGAMAERFGDRKAIIAGALTYAAGLVLMGLGVPVAFAFFATNILGLFVFFGGSRGVTQMVSNFSEAISTYSLAPLPMFLVMVLLVAYSHRGWLLFMVVQKDQVN